eukprot:Filipodium_phascolosomae@DN5909_c0_g1_i1.p1
MMTVTCLYIILLVGCVCLFFSTWILFQNFSWSKIDNVSLIGVLIPSKCQGEVTEEFPLFKYALPSLIKTVEPYYMYNVYIAIDSADPLERYVEALQSMSKDNIRIVPIVQPGGSFVAAVNYIARVAYDDGVDYMVRINDDTEFASNQWTSAGIKRLQWMNPPNVGVVGPKCLEGNQSILTHDMTHRTHYNIFKYYYPPIFQNWYIDNWITTSYKLAGYRISRLSSWRVIHQLSIPRYTIDMDGEEKLKEQVKIGRAMIQDHVATLRNWSLK